MVGWRVVGELVGRPGTELSARCLKQNYGPRLAEHEVHEVQEASFFR